MKEGNVNKGKNYPRSRIFAKISLRDDVSQAVCADYRTLMFGCALFFGVISFMALGRLVPSWYIASQLRLSTAKLPSGVFFAISCSHSSLRARPLCSSRLLWAYHSSVEAELLLSLKFCFRQPQPHEIQALSAVMQTAATGYLSIFLAHF